MVVGRHLVVYTISMSLKQTSIRVPEEFMNRVHDRAKANYRTFSAEVQYLCDMAMRAEQQSTTTGAGA